MFAWIPLLADDPPKGPPPAFDSLFVPVALMLAFLFFIIMPMRRTARDRKNMMAALKKGDRVLINGFMIAQVLQIIPSEIPRGEDQLLIKIDENSGVKMRVVRSAVTAILGSEEAKEGS